MSLRTLAFAFSALLIGTSYAASAETSDIGFESPAQAIGELRLSATWIVVFFDHDAQSTLAIQQLESKQATRTTFTEVDANSPLIDYNEDLPPSTELEPIGEGDLTLNFTRLGSLVIHADAIVLATPGTAVLQGRAPGDNLRSYAPAHLRDVHHFWSNQVDGAQAVATLTPNNSERMPLELRATGVRFIEWFGPEVLCKTESCPSGGGRSRDMEGSNGIEVIRTTDRYISTTGDGTARLHLVGDAKGALTGAPALDANVTGLLRLPKFEGRACADCPLGDDNTLRARGNLSLQQMRPSNSGRLVASLTGAVETVSIDEQMVPEDLLASNQVAAVATGLGVVAIIKWLVAPLFTRLSREQALLHPRRKMIFEYIQQHPGANFREVARATDIAAGTVRHHLNVLRRSDLIVEHTHGSTVRLFENQLRFQQNWADLVLLREPSLGHLYDWLKANPGAPQKAVLEGMEAAGWSRSTTQHRLARLVDGGLATIKQQGRLKLYTATDRSGPPPKGLGGSGPVPPNPGPSSPNPA